MADPNMIETNCPACGARLRLPASHAGKYGRRAKCQQVFTVPFESSPQPNQPEFEGLLNDLKPSSPSSPFTSSEPTIQHPDLKSGNNPFSSGTYSQPTGHGSYGSNPAYAPNPYGDGYGPSYQSQPNSSLPVISLITGIISWCMCCCSIISIPVALVAVVTGHMGAMATTANRSLAYVGMIFGYSHLLIVGGITILSLVGPAFNPKIKPGGFQPMQPGNPIREMEEELGQANEIDYFCGNDATAQSMAEDFADTMFLAQGELFTADELARFELDQNPSATYCEQEAGKCAFVVSVPTFNRFSPDQRRAYQALAWRTAHDIAFRELAEGDDLAVGILLASPLYGNIQTGKLGSQADDIEHIEYSGGDRLKLKPFFREEGNGFGGQIELPDMKDAEAPDAPAEPDAPAPEAPQDDPSQPDANNSLPPLDVAPPDLSPLTPDL